MEKNLEGIHQLDLVNRSYHDDTAFIFSIDKRELYPNIHGKSAVDSFYNLGPCFLGDSIKIFDNFLSM